MILLGNGPEVEATLTIQNENNNMSLPRMEPAILRFPTWRFRALGFF